MKKALVVYALVIGTSALVGCASNFGGTLNYTANTQIGTSRSDAYVAEGSTNSTEKVFDGGGLDGASASVVPQ